MEIHLNWHGPYSLEDARDGDPGQTVGLYQYMGMNTVYGPMALLYLGKSNIHIGNRLADHNLHEWSSLPVEILIGEMVAKTNLESNREAIDLAERLLIYTHSPAWNSANVANPNFENMPPDLHIFNWGIRGHLLPEVSVRRWSAVGNKFPNDLKHEK